VREAEGPEEAPAEKAEIADASKSNSNEATVTGASGPAMAEDTASAPFRAASRLLAIARRLATALLIALTRMERALIQIGKEPRWSPGAMRGLRWRWSDRRVMEKPEGQVKSKTQSQHHPKTQAGKEQGQQVGKGCTTVSRANQTKPRST